MYLPNYLISSKFSAFIYCIQASHFGDISFGSQFAIQVSLIRNLSFVD